MRGYSAVFEADLRLAILQVLTAAETEVNVPILRASIEAATPHRPAAEKLRQEITWLAERGLVAKRAIGASIAAATVTERGEDVARGREGLTGVAAPGLD